jgi:hypothetical protein
MRLRVRFWLAAYDLAAAVRAPYRLHLAALARAAAATHYPEEPMNPDPARRPF